MPKMRKSGNSASDLSSYTGMLKAGAAPSPACADVTETVSVSQQKVLNARCRILCTLLAVALFEINGKMMQCIGVTVSSTVTHH